MLTLNYKHNVTITADKNGFYDFDLTDIDTSETFFSGNIFLLQGDNSIDFTKIIRNYVTSYPDIVNPTSIWNATTGSIIMTDDGTNMRSVLITVYTTTPTTFTQNFIWNYNTDFIDTTVDTMQSLNVPLSRYATPYTPIPVSFTSFNNWNFISAVYSNSQIAGSNIKSYYLGNPSGYVVQNKFITYFSIPFFAVDGDTNFVGKNYYYSLSIPYQYTDTTSSTDYVPN